MLTSWTTVLSMLGCVLANCGQTTFNSDYGTVQSPGYPSQYPALKTCTYDITVSSSRRVILQWNAFNVDGEMPLCTNSNDDSVAIYIGCSSSRSFLTRFCSRNAGMPHTIYSRDNCLRIVFKSSSSSNRGTGFHASFSSSGVDDPISSSRDCRDGTSTSKSGVIYSPLWPAPYPFSYSECEWKLKTSSSYVYKLNFMHFRVYSSSFCSSSYSDRVVVKGKKSKYTTYDNQNSYCGSKGPFSLRTRYYELEIDFEQGRQRSKSKSGFVMGYVAYQPDDVPSSKFGIGSIVGALIAIAVVGVCIFLAVRIYRGRCANRNQPRTIVQSAPQQPIVTTTTNYSTVPQQGAPGYPSGAPAPYPTAKYPPQNPYPPSHQGGYPPMQMPYQGDGQIPPPYLSQNAPPPYQTAATMPQQAAPAPYPPAQGAWNTGNPTQNASAPPPAY